MLPTRCDMREFVIFFGLLAGFALLLKGWQEAYLAKLDAETYRCSAQHWRAVATGNEHPPFRCY